MKDPGSNVAAAVARPDVASRASAHGDVHDYGPATGADRVRQLLNVVGALAQVGISVWIITAGTDEFAQPTPGGDPPLTPAGYAFAIWTPIYAGTIAYAIRQALPRHAARPLFRHAGWGSALALLATSAWLLVAQERERAWATVAVFAVIAAGLAIAVRAVEREMPLSTRADRLLVRAPLGAFLGWTTVAIFANIGAALRWSGATQPGGETGVSIGLLTAATAIAAWTTIATRGNAWYAGAVAWGTIAIAVADFGGWRRTPNPVVGTAALVATSVVMGALAVAWMRRRREAWGTVG